MKLFLPVLLVAVLVGAVPAHAFDAYQGSSITPTACLELTRTLTVGSADTATNKEVSSLQKFLKAEGVFPDAQVTGYFGPATSAALQRWQKANEIRITGSLATVGPTTRAALRAGCADRSTLMFKESGISFEYPGLFEVGSSAEAELLPGPRQYYRFDHKDAEWLPSAYFQSGFSLSYGIKKSSSEVKALHTTTSTVTLRDNKFVRTVGPSYVFYDYMSPTHKNIVLYRFEYRFGTYGRYPDALRADMAARDQLVWVTIDQKYDHGALYKHLLNQEPVVKKLTGPKKLKVGESGTWTLGVTDSDSDVIRYRVAWERSGATNSDEKDNPYRDSYGALQWMGGIGEEFEGPSISHEFAAPGTYPIYFLIGDGEGNIVTKETKVKVVK